jgi:hypothetical protein
MPKSATEESKPPGAKNLEVPRHGSVVADFSTAWKKLSTAWKTFSTPWKFRIFPWEQDWDFD